MQDLTTLEQHSAFTVAESQIMFSWASSALDSITLYVLSKYSEKGWWVRKVKEINNNLGKYQCQETVPAGR